MTLSDGQDFAKPQLAFRLPCDILLVKRAVFISTDALI